jgi:hypothetical protein
VIKKNNSLTTFDLYRLQFKKLVNTDSSQIVNLHSGECYAVENMTKTDRLALLVTGRLNVLTEKSFLHNVGPHEFLDSPEFESSNSEETFRVSVCAAVTSTFVVWNRSDLEYLFVKEPYLAQVLSIVIARDITKKLYVMNSKLRLRDNNDDNNENDEESVPLDIRLPGIAAGISRMNNRQHANFRNNNFMY